MNLRAGHGQFCPLPLPPAPHLVRGVRPNVPPPSPAPDLWVPPPPPSAPHHTCPSPPPLPSGLRPGPPPVPLTLVSGFLGSGKTTLLQRIIRSSAPTARVGVIVNDLAAVNIDAELLRGTTVATATAVDVDAGLLRGGAVTAATASDTVAVAVLPEAVAVADGVDGGQGPMDVGSLIPGLPSKKPRMEGPPVGGGSSSSNAHAPAVGGSSSSNAHAPAVGGSSSSHARAPAGGGTSSSHARAPPAPAHIVELSNGCICCTLRGELVLEVARLLATAAAAGQAGQGGGAAGRGWPAAPGHHRG